MLLLMLEGVEKLQSSEVWLYDNLIHKIIKKKNFTFFASTIIFIQAIQVSQPDIKLLYILYILMNHQD